MAVAPSFQALEKIMPPFVENGREYIYVICKNGNKRKVRWYSDKDAEKMDKRTVLENKPDFEGFNAHEAFFFGEKDFITIYDGPEEVINEWREEIPQFSVLENRWFGFYSPSYFVASPPPGVRSIILHWEEIRRHNDKNCNAMKDPDIVQHYVAEKLYGHNTSEYQGEKDEWFIRKVKIVKNITTETHYGETHIHIMHDENDNEYVWTTASKNLEENSELTIKMKVKGHKEYKGVKQTIVYYCKVI